MEFRQEPAATGAHVEHISGPTAEESTNRVEAQALAVPPQTFVVVGAMAILSLRLERGRDSNAHDTSTAAVGSRSDTASLAASRSRPVR